MMYNLWEGSGGLGDPSDPRMMHHPMMHLCRVDFQPFTMQSTLSGQMYNGHHQFEGILELRKEKSRDAARSRRGKENYEFYELAKLLPLPGAITSQLDKASIVRLTISNLKLKDFSCHGDPPWSQEGAGHSKTNKGSSRRRTIANYAIDAFETHQGTHILQSLDGFGFTLSNDGRFLYISETVSIYLGLSQVEMTGSSIFDYVHTEDQQELAEQLGLSAAYHCSFSSSRASPSPPSGDSQDGNDDDDTGRSSSPLPSSNNRTSSPATPERTSIMTPSLSRGSDRCFCIRMKSTLTKRGVHVKTSGYRVVHVLARLRAQFSFSTPQKHPPPILGLVGVAIALPSPTVTELYIDNDMFVTRLGPAFNITFCEPRISDLMDLRADDLTNQSLYHFCHAQDLQMLKNAHINLLSKSQVMTEYYRLMNKHGGYVWIQTCATVLFNSKSPDEQSIIAINYVLSGLEHPGCMMNTRQLSAVTGIEMDEDRPQAILKSEQTQSSEALASPALQGSAKSSKLDSPDAYQCSSENPCKDNVQTPPTLNSELSSTKTSGIVDFPQLSPPSANISLYCSAQQEESQNDQADIASMYTEDEPCGGEQDGKLDNKLSRRKMDKPRKRKREATVKAGGSVAKGSKVNSSSGKSVDHAQTIFPQSSTNANTKLGYIQNTVVSPTNGAGNGVILTSDNVHSTLTSNSPNTITPHSVNTPTPEDLTNPSQNAKLCTPEQHHQSLLLADHVENGIVVPNSCAQTLWRSNDECTEGTRMINNTEALHNSSSVRDLEEVVKKHLPLGSHIDDEMRQDYAQTFLGNKSTIQWVGSNTATPDMAASNLLRSLYANRETVIRSNVYTPKSQYYHDVQSSLLTPAGASVDPYKETFPFQMSHSNKVQPSTYSGLSYQTNTLSVAMPSEMANGFSVTPPSSVSPHDKYQMPYCEQLPYGSDSLKGQHTYPLPAHNNASFASYDRTMGSHYASYYGNTSTLSPYSSHTVHYRDPPKHGAW